MTTPTTALTSAEIPSLTISEPELMEVLESSVYPGASQASIKLVIAYCRASRLDPLQKPVHIVPMDVKVKKQKKKETDKDEFEYVKRDVIMPGIGLYRTQATRTRQYVGKDKPVFGPIHGLKLKRKYQEFEDGPEKTEEYEFQYPEWCEVTVRRLVGERVVEFTATEYWLENYATKGRNSKFPNAMWERRSRGQLAKCAEAQALRMGFPEAVGSQPTADEMEGKTLEDDEAIEGQVTGRETTAINMPKALPAEAGGTPMPATAGATPAPVPATQAATASTTASHQTNGASSEPVSAGLLDAIKRKMADAALGEADLVKRFNHGYPGITKGNYNAVSDWIKNPAGDQ